MRSRLDRLQRPRSLRKAVQGHRQKGSGPCALTANPRRSKASLISLGQKLLNVRVSFSIARFKLNVARESDSRSPASDNRL